MAMRITSGTRVGVPQGKGSSLVPANARVVSDWDSLNSGDEIIVLDQATGFFFGTVDALTDDRSIMWVQLDNGLGRRLFMRLDGCKVWRVTPKS